MLQETEVMGSGLRTTAAEFQLCLILAMRPQTLRGPSASPGPPRPARSGRACCTGPSPSLSARPGLRLVVGVLPPPRPGPSLRSTLPPTRRRPSSSRPSPALGSLATRRSGPSRPVHSDQLTCILTGASKTEKPLWPPREPAGRISDVQKAE